MEEPGVVMQMLDTKGPDCFVFKVFTLFNSELRLLVPITSNH